MEEKTMKPVKTNLYTAAGIFLVGMTLLFKKLLGLPEFFIGLGLALGIVFELVGVSIGCRGQNRLKDAKLSFLRKLTGSSNA